MNLTTKIAVFVIVSSLSFSGIKVYAGNNGGNFSSGSNAHAEHKKLSHGLDLSDAQKKQMKELMEKKQQSMKAVHEQFKADLQKILTPEQFAKFSKSKDERKERMGKNKHMCKECMKHKNRKHHGHDEGEDHEKSQIK